MSLPNFWQRGRLGKGGSDPQIIFSQVQEDAATELRVLEDVNAKNIFCIASGGCTALSLLSLNPDKLLACDINPAQIALVEIKRAVLESLSPEEIMFAFYVHTDVAYKKLSVKLAIDVDEF